MGDLVDAVAIAQPYMDEVRRAAAALGEIRLVGLLGTRSRASRVYADYATRGCEEVGIRFELREVEPEEVSGELFRASEDPAVHGVIVFYPVFGGVRDRTLQNELAPEKDVEGLHAVWSRRLYNDVRVLDREGTKKAVLPCTPLGIVKALGALGVTRGDVPPRESARGLEVVIYNRSEVVGRPLAAMLAHDGARVVSFDIDGAVLYERAGIRPLRLGRAEALAAADVVVTGVPTKAFPRVAAAEIKAGATCVNFSHVRNLADDVPAKAAHTLLRVGPITVAMLLRNTVRLYRNFHALDDDLESSGFS